MLILLVNIFLRNETSMSASDSLNPSDLPGLKLLLLSATLELIIPESPIYVNEKKTFVRHAKIFVFFFNFIKFFLTIYDIFFIIE